MRKRRARRTCVEPQSRGLHVDVLGLLGVLRKPSSDNVSQLLAIHAVTVCSVPVAVPTTVGSARGSASGSGSGN